VRRIERTYLVGFEEQHDCQHGQSSFAFDGHSQDDEDDAAERGHEHDVSRLDIQQQARAREPSRRKDTLTDSVAITSIRRRKMRHVLRV